MKKVFAVLLLFVFSICGIQSNDTVIMSSLFRAIAENRIFLDNNPRDTYTIYNFSYCVPSNWITKPAEKGYYHYGHEESSTDGGYLYTFLVKTFTPEYASTLNDNNINDCFRDYFKGAFGSDDMPIKTAKGDGYWAAICNGEFKNGLYVYTLLCIDHENAYGLVYANTSTSHEVQQEEFFEIINTIQIMTSNKNDSVVQNEETQDDKEILFRNAPWGISFVEAKNRFPEFYLVDFTTGYETYCNALYHIPYGFEDEQVEYDGDYLGIHAVSFEHTINVGGYTADSVTMDFAYIPSNGILNRSELKTQLYHAGYTFSEIRDVDTAVSSLTDKLSSLYGSPDATGKNKYYTWNVWFGANNTGVSIKSENTVDSTGKRYIWITYFTKYGDKWLQDALDAENETISRAEKESSESHDTSGL